MMTRVLPVMLGALWLAGCQGSLVRGAIEGPEVLAQQDHGYCESIGAEYGSSDYVECRLELNRSREARHENARSRIGRSLQAPSSADTTVIMDPAAPTSCVTRDIRTSTMSKPNYVTTCQ